MAVKLLKRSHRYTTACHIAAVQAGRSEFRVASHETNNFNWLESDQLGSDRGSVCWARFLARDKSYVNGKKLDASVQVSSL